MKFSIGGAGRRDLRSVTRLYRKLYKGDEHMPFYRARLGFGRLRAGQSVYVARSGKELVGFLWFVWYEHIKHKGVGYIEELYVDKGFRGKRIGRKLVDAAVKEARARKMLVVFVTTALDMHDAQRFYKAVGFKQMRNGQWFVKSIV